MYVHVCGRVWVCMCVQSVKEFVEFQWEAVGVIKWLTYSLACCPVQGPKYVIPDGSRPLYILQRSDTVIILSVNGNAASNETALPLAKSVVKTSYRTRNTGSWTGIGPVLPSLWCWLSSGPQFRSCFMLELSDIWDQWNDRWNWKAATAITWTNVDLSVKSNGIHLRAISSEIPQP